MELVISVVILIVSLAVLAKASHLTIKSTEDLIENTGLSEASAGFVILSVMSTLPEVTVAVFAVYQGIPGISIGDILGSHLFNIGIVIGILAVMGLLKKCRPALLLDLVDILFLASIIPLLLVISRIAIPNPIVESPLVGMVLLGAFVCSVYRMAKRRSPVLEDPKEHQAKERKRIFMWIIIGAIITAIASRFAVSSASDIAYFLGVSPVIIGARIVAVGTSLPELAFCFTAAKRGRVYLALGDAIGANLTTITFVLGFVLLLSPFAIEIAAFTKILLFVLATNLVLWHCLARGGISQIGGIILILIYVLFQATVEL